MAGSPLPIVLLADPRPDALACVERLLHKAGFEVRAAGNGQDALDIFYRDAPRCLVIKHGLSLREGKSLLDEIKSDNVYGHLPAIVLMSEQEIQEEVDWSAVPADDYVVEPVSGPELLSRIRMCWARALRDVNANPLTGLPGNLSINQEAQRRIASSTPFAFAYLDLDTFKAYNDKYGFSRGDEVLRMTARVIVNVIRSLESDETYVGHIGGDDFVFMTPPHLIIRACQECTKNFSLIVPNFYDEDDRAADTSNPSTGRAMRRGFP